MKPLYTQQEFENSKSDDLLKCKCYQCSTSFKTKKKRISEALKSSNINLVKFCSRNCQMLSLIKRKSVICTNCLQTFKRTQAEINKTNNNNQFCSKSCAASYNNKNKTHGYRRSKLEIWLEERLTNLYPNLSIDFNKKSAIGSELDIYILSLNLAIELNGIFHYEPIYGTNKLNQIQSNDISKSKACLDNRIDLCIIDISQQKYFKPNTSQKYLDIIINIINERI